MDKSSNKNRRRKAYSREVVASVYILSIMACYIDRSNFATIGN